MFGPALREPGSITSSGESPEGCPLAPWAGNKTRGLVAVRQVVETGGATSFVQAEAMFALWDVQVREREVPGPVATARMLARDFPENRELRRFHTIHAPTAATISPDHNAP